MKSVLALMLGPHNNNTKEVCCTSLCSFMSLYFLICDFAILTGYPKLTGHAPFKVYVGVLLSFIRTSVDISEDHIAK